jgi:hypothetical protein
MLHPDHSRTLHAQRLREAQVRGLGGRQALEARPQSLRGRSLRRAVGRTVVRIGQAIEAEPRRPVAS